MSCDACLAVCAMVSGTSGAGVCACVVATEAVVAISGILMVSEWGAAMVIVSVGHMLMNNGDVLEVPYPCLCCDDAENMRSICVCGYLRGYDSCSQDCSIEALNLLAVSACLYLFFCPLMVRRTFAAAAIVGSSMVRTAVARTAALQR